MSEANKPLVDHALLLTADILLTAVDDALAANQVDLAKKLVRRTRRAARRLRVLHLKLTGLQVLADEVKGDDEADDDDE